MNNSFINIEYETCYVTGLELGLELLIYLTDIFKILNRSAIKPFHHF